MSRTSVPTPHPQPDNPALPPFINTRSPYVGRFAPSPTGPLHFGSLVTALGSYLDAKSRGGRWLVRMEDLDKPREQPGAAADILHCLETHGLEWDGEFIYQSSRFAVYEAELQALIARDLVYPCQCSRQRLQALGGIYDGHCRRHAVNPNQPLAWRLKLYDLPHREQALVQALAGSDYRADNLCIDDKVHGRQCHNLRTEAGDQILKRRDGFFAYQLAVVVDDRDQQVTHVVRGSDLLDVSIRQRFLFHILGAPAPNYAHLPLAIQPNGQKLSKQNHAQPLQFQQAPQNLWQALHFLGQNPPRYLLNESVSALLDWGIKHWQLARVEGKSRLYPGAQ